MLADKDRWASEAKESSAGEMSEDEIDENVMESFPASDPPSWTLGIDPEHKSRSKMASATRKKTISLLGRQATSADIPALQGLSPASVRALSAGFYDERQSESAIQYVFGVDTQLIDDGTYYIAESAGQIVGCGGWSKRKTLYGGDQAKAAEDPLLDPATEAARIRAFFVHPDWARRGVGSRLMATCEEAARQANFTTLELVATLPGEPLYKAFGYEPIDRFDIVMPDGLTLPVVRMGKRF